MDKFFIAMYAAVKYGMHNSTAHPEYYNPFGGERFGYFMEGYHDYWMTVRWCIERKMFGYMSAQTIK